MAHATHPNYPDRHEPGHLIAVNGGPVLKVQPNLRYATEGRTAAVFELACSKAGAAAALRAPGRPAMRIHGRTDHRCPDGGSRPGAPQPAMHRRRRRAVGSRGHALWRRANSHGRPPTMISA